MKIWAHRGCCYTWPENTLQSFEAASKLPVTGIELDIQLTKDRKMVVIHDEKVDRTTNGKGWVKDFTLEEIKALKIETHPVNCVKQYTQVPTIEEVFTLLKPVCLSKGLLINIELKTSEVRYEGIEDMIVALVKEWGLDKYIVYSSFNPDSIVLIKQKYPYVNAGILYDSEKLCLEFSQKYPVNALHPYVEMLDVPNIREKTDLPIRVWNEEEIFYPGKEPCKHYDFEKLEKLGVTDIFTNIADYYCSGK